MGTVLSGTWSDEGPVCSFTLEKWAAVFARQIFYVRLSVNNPRQAIVGVKHLCRATGVDVALPRHGHCFRFKSRLFLFDVCWHSLELFMWNWLPDMLHAVKCKAACLGFLPFQLSWHRLLSTKPAASPELQALQALMRTDPTNVWQIKLSGANATLLGGLVNFISLAEEPGVLRLELQPPAVGFVPGATLKSIPGSNGFRFV